MVHAFLKWEMPHPQQGALYGRGFSSPLTVVLLKALRYAKALINNNSGGKGSEDDKNNRALGHKGGKGQVLDTAKNIARDAARTLN